MATCGVDLNALLNEMDRCAANLSKLDAVWQRAEPMLPTGPAMDSSQEYDDLRRAWASLQTGLAPIDGFTVVDALPDMQAIGAAYLGFWEIGEAPYLVHEEAERPGKDLAEYRYRMGQARRRAVRDRLEELTAVVESALAIAVRHVPRDSPEPLAGPVPDLVRVSVQEVERLLGDLISRRGRWGDLHRHLHFSQGHDWHDIREFDWPSVREDIEAAAFGDTDPLPVAAIDLGAASRASSGAVTTVLAWDALEPSRFERLLYDLLRGLPGHQNVQLLMKTNAPDRGRDLSLERVLDDHAGGIRTERVIVQAKHWRSRSVRLTDVNDLVAELALWEPPVVRAVVVATPGDFTTDAVAWSEKHNDDGKRPHIELGNQTRLETLLSQHPHIAVAYGLR